MNDDHDPNEHKTDGSPCVCNPYIGEGIVIHRSLKELASELKQIHDVVMSIGDVTEAPESDPYTVREVKRMALRISEQEAKIWLLEKVIKEQEAEISKQTELLRDRGRIEQVSDCVLNMQCKKTGSWMPCDECEKGVS